jgi:hypothetical protein
VGKVSSLIQSTLHLSRSLSLTSSFFTITISTINSRILAMMLKSSVLGLFAISGITVHASSLFPVPLPLSHDHAIDPRLQVLAMGSVFGRAEANATTAHRSSFAMSTAAPQTSPAARRRIYGPDEQPEGCPWATDTLSCRSCGGVKYMFYEGSMAGSARCLGVSLDFANNLKRP